MLRLLSLTLFTTLLAGCSLTGVNSNSTLDTPWQCTPINPLVAALPENPCFRAVVQNDNEITLQWRLAHPTSSARIYKDIGTAEDAEFQRPVCRPAPADTCFASVRVETGGYRQWQLAVTHPSGSTIYVPAALDVPAPYPLKAVYGGGFVDMLAPTEQQITWLADPRNAPCGSSKEDAWVEREGYFFAENRHQLARCGRDARVNIRIEEISKPGSRTFRLRDCYLPPDTDTPFCSPYVSVAFRTTSDHFLGPTVAYATSGEDLTVAFTTASGDIRRLSSETLIRAADAARVIETATSRHTIPAALLTPGEHKIALQSCDSTGNTCSPPAALTVLVDSPVSWELNRDYTRDFLPGKGYSLLGTGEPLDITYDASGGIWVINEFSDTVEYISPARASASMLVPLAHSEGASPADQKSVTPFAIDMGIDRLLPTNLSTLGERITLVGSKIWFTQGGGMLGPVDIANHSRVISFDPARQDSTATFFDDRFCAYNVPTDDENGFGNNQVIGLTATPNRIWIGESRSLFGTAPSAISSFVPDPTNCENLLNFNDADALAQQHFQYCKPAQTPEQDGCLQKFLFDQQPAGLKVAHLATDPVDGSIWFTDPQDKFLGNLKPDRQQPLILHPLPSDGERQAGEDPTKAGFPWSLRVDDNVVYFARYANRRLVRFDKATGTFDEIVIPAANAEIGLHSIAIDPEFKRLWFTLSNEMSAPLDKKASTIGYIDLSSWDNHVSDPSPDNRISAVIYSGLDTIVAPDIPAHRHASFRGITFDPASRKIALATHDRVQVTELTPLPGF